MTPDQSQVIRVAAGLLKVGAIHGASIILFNAALMAGREAEAARVRWTPDGPLPLPANDPAPSLMPDSIA